MENRKELAKEALRAMSEMEELNQMEQIVKDNKIEYTIAGQTYRVRKPTAVESIEIDTFRRKQFTEFMSDDSYMFKKQWIEKYQKKGIDIGKMEKEVQTCQYEVKQLLLRLATSEEPKTIESLKKQIEALKETMYNTSIEITELLSLSIETQLQISATSYATFLVLETNVSGEWKRTFANYEEFRASELEVVQKACYYINYLISPVG